jgi:hypothetical protein
MGPAARNTRTATEVVPSDHPPIELASRPRSRLDLGRRFDFSVISFGKMLHVVVAEIHI